MGRAPKGTRQRRGASASGVTVKDELDNLVCHTLDYLRVEALDKPDAYGITARCTCGMELEIPQNAWERIVENLDAPKG